jgi:hypothetical protein
MEPIFIAAAGIYVTARVLSFVFDELREDEIQRQEEIVSHLDSYNDKIVAYKQKQQEQEEQKNREELFALYEKKKGYLLDAVLLRIEDLQELRKEIGEAREKTLEAIKSKETIVTPLRRSSLELLLRQLSEANEKCIGYIQYLKDYQKALQRMKIVQADVSPFAMRIPSDFPYRGHILWLDLQKARSSQQPCSILIQGLISVTIVIDDIHEFEDLPNGKIPVMVSHYGVQEDWNYHASIEKGLFQTEELQNTHLGTVATVTEFKENAIILTYRNSLLLYLPKNNLINPYRFPPLHSELTVFPTKWQYALNVKNKENNVQYPVTVSERREDAMSALSFTRFPVGFERQRLQELIAYLKENHLLASKDEWLLGPLDEQDHALHTGMKLKLQLGSMPLCILEVREMPQEQGILRYYLAYSGLCDKEEKSFSADDIFVPFDVSIMPYIIGTAEQTIADCAGIDQVSDVECFMWDIYEEFRIQHRIKEERTGLSYFLKWENITNQLVDYLTQGDSFVLQISWAEPHKQDSIFAEIQNQDELQQFLYDFNQKNSGSGHEWKPQFFVKDESGMRYTAILMDGGAKINVMGRRAAEQFDLKSRDLELFVQEIPYAECQQRAALQRFRSGQLVNASIQVACLNGASAHATLLENVELKPFHNKNLETNEAQRTAVERAFKEKNHYFIQGPPGTGKTTVIRELIEQVFDADPMANVLIVSQANVAVDNALSGDLLEKYKDEIVRCGNANKISSDLQSVTLHSRCKEYLADLESRKDQFSQEYYEEWMDIVAPKGTEGVSPTLCELVIRKHRLVGATCVGIAKRRIGLERTEFDLAIVDEAGKALPAEILIPLLRAKKVVLIGDHKQLPPVIDPILYDEEKIDLEEREISVNQLFAHSFFERIYSSAPDECKTMLDVQFRMPAVIGSAISELFYDGKLKNGQGTEERKPIFEKNNLTFYNFDKDPAYKEEKSKGQLINRREAEAVALLVQSIREKDKAARIAVITPYKGQKRLISNVFIQRKIHYRVDNIAVDTIDAFQGSEAEVVIFCTTRALQPTSFFKDTRRINVALSRARNDLIIMGKLSYFSKKYKDKNSCLPTLAQYIQVHGEVVDTSTMLSLQKKVQRKSSAEAIVSLLQIDIPSAFYEMELDHDEVQSRIDDFYQYGDFREPLVVRRKEDNPERYTLQRGYAQILAAQELDLQECWISIME